MEGGHTPSCKSDTQKKGEANKKKDQGMMDQDQDPKQESTRTRRHCATRNRRYISVFPARFPGTVGTCTCVWAQEVGAHMYM